MDFRSYKIIKLLRNNILQFYSAYLMGLMIQFKNVIVYVKNAS